MNHFCGSYRLFCFLIWMVTLLPAGAQQSGFVHLQSENNLPYQVQWNGNTLASSANGYLVIPQVMAGTHTLVISFAPEISVPYTFTITVGDKPKGFSIRQGVDNSWRLFDLIDYSLVAGKPAPPKIKTILAEETALPVLQQTVDKPRDTARAAIVKVPALLPVKPQRSTIEIKKIFDRESLSGIDQVYVITKANRSDTIALFIPVLQDNKPAQLARLSHISVPATVEKALYLSADRAGINDRNRNQPQSK